MPEIPPDANDLDEGKHLDSLLASVDTCAIFVVGLDGLVGSWNAGGKRLFGYSPEEIIGKHVSSLRTGDEARPEVTERELDFARQSGRADVDGVRLRRDGSSFLANESTVALTTGGRISGFGKVIHDIGHGVAARAGSRPTQANRPERDLRESRERFQLLVESVKDYAIFMLDPTGRVESWNLGAQRIKGYSAAEILGRHFSAFYPPEDIEAGKCELELDIATKSGRFEEEGWRVRKDGTTFWASVVITAVHDRTGLLVGFAKVTRDLTDRIAAEAERLQRVRAEEGERKAAEFLAIMGHELRNPVAPMLTAVELIKLRRGEGCEKEIEVLERQLAHLKRLLDDLLDVSRPSRAETALARREIDVADLVANAIEMASPLVDQRRHQLRVEVRDERLLVDVDPARMAQVLGNLLINAAKYTDPGGHITVRAQREGDFVRVDVVDDGIGISNELMPRLFDAFTQGKQSLERQVGGLGLGLTIVQRLVAEHGGEVFAESDGPGRGSRFSVRLRRVEAPPTSEPLVPVRMAGVLRGGRRVLLVDDNEDSSEMLGMYLEHLGHHVRIALDGPSGLRAATEIQADIAFLDLGLPGMNGYDLATAIRKLPGYEDIPIVAVSGYAGDEDKRAAAAAGFSDHFAKPVEIDRVRQAVDAAPRRTSD